MFEKRLMTIKIIIKIIGLIFSARFHLQFNKQIEKWKQIMYYHGITVISSPTLIVSGAESTTLFIGKGGSGKYEKPPIAPRRLCNESDNASIGNCQNDAFRNDVITHFHPDLRIGNLAGGFCMEITESNETGVVNQVCRCVMMGTYVDATTGQKEMLRLHFFNHANDPTVAVMAYFGNKTLEPVTK